MNEDYLWDKTGNDAEIERLENALAEFRYRETAAPAVFPAKVFAAVEKGAKRRIFTFSFAFAFASCAAFMLILLGVWFQIAGKNPAAEPDSANLVAPEAKPDLPENPFETIAPIESAAFPPKEKLKIAKAKNPIPAKKISPQKAKFVKQMKKSPPKTEKVVLTEEEQYAYSQLMLALSITSSKLNLVREKVALGENPNILIRKENIKGRN